MERMQFLLSAAVFILFACQKDILLCASEQTNIFFIVQFQN